MRALFAAVFIVLTTNYVSVRSEGILSCDCILDVFSHHRNYANCNIWLGVNVF